MKWDHTVIPVGQRSQRDWEDLSAYLRSWDIGELRDACSKHIDEFKRYLVLNRRFYQAAGEQWENPAQGVDAAQFIPLLTGKLAQIVKYPAPETVLTPWLSSARVGGYDPVSNRLYLDQIPVFKTLLRTLFHELGHYVQHRVLDPQHPLITTLSERRLAPPTMQEEFYDKHPRERHANELSVQLVQCVFPEQHIDI